MEDLAGRGGLHDLHVDVGRQLHEAFDAGGGVFRPLSKRIITQAVWAEGILQIQEQLDSSIQTRMLKNFAFMIVATVLFLEIVIISVINSYYYGGVEQILKDRVNLSASQTLSLPTALTFFFSSVMTFFFSGSTS